MDENVTLASQQQQEEEAKKNGRCPVILISKFNVNSKKIDQFLRAWATDAAVMKRQPGFISHLTNRCLRSL
jgi:hypothetical protein